MIPRNETIRDLIRTRIAAGASAYQIAHELGQATCNIMRYIRSMELPYESRKPKKGAVKIVPPKRNPPPVPARAESKPPPPPPLEVPLCPVCGDSPSTVKMFEGKAFFSPCEACQTAEQEDWQ